MTNFLILLILLSIVLWGNATDWWRYDSNKPIKSQEVVASANIDNYTGRVRISIENYAFNPKEIKIVTGTTVVWINNDYDFISHQIISDNKSFSSPVLRPGDKFQFKFDQPGEYSYHCSILNNMTAKIVVEGD